MGGLFPWADHYVSRDRALLVPAFRRAVTLVGSTLGQMHIRQMDSTRRVVATSAFLRQPDPKRTLAALLTDTYTDLALWGAAYWYNPRWATEDGWRYAGSPKRKHRSVERIAPEDVAEVTHRTYTIYRYDERGVSHPVTVPVEAMISFECASGNWLRDGAQILSTAGLAEEAVRMYLATPVPTTVIKNNGPRKTAAQVEELLGIVEESRRKRSTAYVGRDIDLTSFGFDSAQIGLESARAQIVLDIARLTGIPALYLSQAVLGSSLTYSNMTQQRLDLHAALQPFATAVEQRLSFDDVTGDGSYTEVDFGPFLRVDPTMRADLYSKLIPLGVMTVEQAQLFEELTPTDQTLAPTATDPGGGIEGPNRTGTGGQPI